MQATNVINYWGVSNKQGLEYILAHDSDSVIIVCSACISGDFNELILTPDQRARIRFSDCDSTSDYFMTNYRWHPGEYDFPESRKFYSVKVLDSSILTIFRIKQ